MIPKRREAEKPPLATSAPVSPPPATSAPASPKSAFATPFTPSCNSKTVSLFDWWLVSVNEDPSGIKKRLAIGGFTIQGKLATKVFTSAPIVARYDAFTLETADGITVRIRGCIDKARSASNGIPPEICRCFVVGFPCNWVYYADGDFWNKHTSTNIPTSSSDIYTQSNPPASLHATSVPTSSSAMSVPATAPNSPKATPLISSCYSKTVYLFDWWLIRVNDDSNSSKKRLAVGGFTTQGKLQTRVFTSAPIVARFDAYTLETADGITVRVHGFINKERTSTNGFLPEVCRYFLVGFPYNWENYADGDFGNNPSSISIPMSTSGSDNQSEQPSDTAKGLFPIHSGVFSMKKFFDILSSTLDTSIDDLLKRYIISTPGKVCGGPLVESLRTDEMDKDEQNHKHSVGSGGNATGSAEDAIVSRGGFQIDENRIDCENFIVNEKDISKYNGSVSASLTINNEEVCRVHGSEDFLVREVPENLSTSSVLRRLNLCPEASFSSLPNDTQKKSADKCTHCFLSSAEGVASTVLSPNGSILTSPKHWRRLGDYAAKSGSHAERIRVHNVSDSENLAVERNLNDHHTTSDANSSMQSISNYLLTKENDVSHNEHGIRPGRYALRSRNCAGKSDFSSSVVEKNVPFESMLVSDVRKSCGAPKRKHIDKVARKSDTSNTISSKNETTVTFSFPISKDMFSSKEEDEVYLNIRKQPENHNKKDCSAVVDTTGVIKTKTLEARESFLEKGILSNLNGNQTEDREVYLHSVEILQESFADVSPFEGNLAENCPLPATEDLISGSNSQSVVHNSRYNTRSRQRKISDSIACKSQSMNDDIGISGSTEMVENPTNITASKSKLRMKKLKKEMNGDQNICSGREVDNDHRSVTVDDKFTNASSDVSQSGHNSIGTRKRVLVSSQKEVTKSKTVFPDIVQKKMDVHSEGRISLQNGNKYESPAVVSSREKVGNLQINVEIESNDLTEAQSTEGKTKKATRQKTLWIPSYSDTLQSPLTRDMAKKLSVSSPELLELKRSRSGRLLVPRISRWRHQKIIYDRDGSITGIIGMDNLPNSPSIGSTTEPQKLKRRKLK